MRIGIVNDLNMAVVAIRQALAASKRHEVAWVASNGAEAVEMAAQDRPDLVLMDLIMPVMDGVEATRRIMAETPCAILVVTATVDGNSPKVFAALGYGALDAVNTPVQGVSGAQGTSPLLAKVDMLEKLIINWNCEKKMTHAQAARNGEETKQEKLVVIGASAGGPVALAKVLSALPVDCPIAVVIIQHLNPQFAHGLAVWLGQNSNLPVRLANEGDRPRAGLVLVAGTADHLVLTEVQTLGYTPNPVEYLYRPSVDVFFQSVTRHWRGKAVGVLLTGMGHDGAQGLKDLRDAGWLTIAQDRDSCVVYGMPKAAAALDAAVNILPLDQIGPALKNWALSVDAQN